MKKNIGLLILLFYCCVIQTACKKQASETINLRGKWAFQADVDDKGIDEKWFIKELNDTIRLPGSMPEYDKGFSPSLTTKWTGSIYDSSWYFNPGMEKYRQPDNLKFPFWLTPRKYYTGAAWYQKEVEIPVEWKNRRIILFLERPHWETTVWIDSVKVGLQNSLSTPHKYDISSFITPGKHAVTIRVDNRVKDINVGPDSHSITDHSQGNWNGIAGELSLIAGSPIYFADIKLYPDIRNHTVKAVIKLGNHFDGHEISGIITLRAKSFNTKRQHQPEPVKAKFAVNNTTIPIEITYPMGDSMLLWDEFNPALYKMTAVLTDNAGNRDAREIQFGMREFKANGTRFEINGRPVFLRGTVDCCVFPITGYPPTDVASWEQIFKKYKSFGINHIRFHSWCPPEAALTAADLRGIYLQVEGPSWANHGTKIGDGKPVDKYLFEEASRIIDAYGNHPSFVMMAYGNEPAGRNQVEYLTKFVNTCKKHDNRRLYTSASIGKNWPLVPVSEFIVRSEARGLPWEKAPQTMFDYGEIIGKYTVPYVAHEMGQYCVYPDFTEIEKYTGVFRAKNFELFREILNENHLGDLAKQFFTASGKFQALCYKNQIEAALRTPGYAGVQLLGINDFPGQGTALVGVLNAFNQEKGYISAEEFHRFFGTVVPLARFPGFVYTTDSVFTAQVEAANFSDKPLNNSELTWKITTENGKILSKGNFSSQTIEIGNCISIGKIEYPLSEIMTASKLNLEVQIDSFCNDWDFWVYPAQLPETDTHDIYFCNELDSKAEKILESGGTVFLQATGKVEHGKDVEQYFRPVFWNTSWFKMRPPHTTGILCNPEHPALAEFPANFHSDMQWWEILHRQQVMNIDCFPPEFRPVIQPIDTWFLNRRLALLFEARTSNGKIMVCSADLNKNIQNRPAARQLLYSIVKYMVSKNFNPEYIVNIKTIKELFEKKNHSNIDFHTNDKPDELKPANK